MRALLTIVFQKALYDVLPLLKGGMHTIKYNTCCIMKKTNHQTVRTISKFNRKVEEKTIPDFQIKHK